MMPALCFNASIDIEATDIGDAEVLPLSEIVFHKSTCVFKSGRMHRIAS